ncbi:hypothetical protein HPB50_009152 [Hyalomma asiaticum]|uniref:Uncharacterized protein n=1 Tax=Hyalomma asiaticum TaxID=266040 RepID=A0ACB7S1A3_HYAAI|nr:hypothetical protein HPB50_009152 [Hyalomma asiaticum]
MPGGSNTQKPTRRQSKTTNKTIHKRRGTTSSDNSPGPDPSSAGFRASSPPQPMGMINVLQVVGGVPAVVLLLSAHELSSIVGRADASVCLLTSVVALVACLMGSPDLPYCFLMKFHSSIAMAAYVPSSANYMCHES